MGNTVLQHYPQCCSPYSTSACQLVPVSCWLAIAPTTVKLSQCTVTILSVCLLDGNRFLFLSSHLISFHLISSAWFDTQAVTALFSVSGPYYSVESVGPFFHNLISPHLNQLLLQSHHTSTLIHKLHNSQSSLLMVDEIRISCWSGRLFFFSSSHSSQQSPQLLYLSLIFFHLSQLSLSVPGWRPRLLVGWFD